VAQLYGQIIGHVDERIDGLRDELKGDIAQVYDSWTA
jgi:hypothetical protein